MSFFRKSSVFSLSVVSVVISNGGICFSLGPLSDAEKEVLENKWEEIEGLLNTCKENLPALSKDSFEAILSEVKNRMQPFENLYNECLEKIKKLGTVDVKVKESMKGRLCGDIEFLDKFFLACHFLTKNLKTKFNEIHGVDPNIEYGGSQEV